MKHYCLVLDGVVVNRTMFDGDMPEGWAEPGAEWYENEDAQIGWTYSDGAFTAPPAPALPAPTADDVWAEKDRRWALGFDYDFGDARGVHHIGTTPKDLIDWQKVSQLAQALLNANQPGQAIPIFTDTGPTQVTPVEWQSVIIATGIFLQPVMQYAAALVEMNPIPDDYAADYHWPA